MENKKYSSIPETMEHVKNVAVIIGRFCNKLLERAKNHDKSKMEKPELEWFDKYTPLLKILEYGTPEYKSSLEALQPALKHHYKHNRHHPEHWETDGNDPIIGMNLIDVIEMFCDWYAASKRTKNGDFRKSIDISCKRFKIGKQLHQIFINTKEDLELN